MSDLTSSSVNVLESATSEQFADQLLCTAIDVGIGMLRSGGEIHRTEDTIERICRAYGAEHVEVFSITSLITAAVRMPDGTYSNQIRRVQSVENHFRRLEALNELSRTICRTTPPLQEVQERLRCIKHEQLRYSLIPYVGTMLGAGGCAVLFGGGWRDGIAAALIGVVMVFLGNHLPRLLNPLARTLIISFVAGTLSQCVAWTSPLFRLDMVMIGTIMMLVPGLAVGNAFRELLCGDLIAGSMRLLQSILTATMMAFGYATSILIMGGIMA